VQRLWSIEFKRRCELLKGNSGIFSSVNRSAWETKQLKEYRAKEAFNQNVDSML